MKNLLRLGIIVLYAFCMMQYQLGNVDIKQTVQRTYTANELKKDSIFEKKVEFKFGQIIKDSLGLDTADILSFYIDTVVIKLKPGICREESGIATLNYSIIILAPGLDHPIVKSSKIGNCNLQNPRPASAPQDAIYFITANDYDNDTEIRDIFSTNHAINIKNNIPITLDFSFKARTDVPAGQFFDIKISYRFKLKTTDNESDEPVGILGGGC